MHTFRPLPRALALVAFLLSGAACAGDTATGVSTAPAASSLLGGLTSRETTLLQCAPAAEPQVATARIGPLGGVLGIGATRVVIPEGAVLGLTDFRLTIPASPLVEISVRAGTAEHFLFLKPVLVSIDYGRCASQLSPLDPVGVWHIDETSKSLLEPMTAVDLRLLHTVTFLTGHLSGYAVAD